MGICNVQCESIKAFVKERIIYTNPLTKMPPATAGGAKVSID